MKINSREKKNINGLQLNMKYKFYAQIVLPKSAAGEPI